MAEEQAAAEDKRLAIVKIYVKDLSLESPRSPDIFRSKEWSPQTNLNLRTTHTAGDDNFHEVVLTISVEAKAKDDDRVLFLIELQQAGLFDMRGYSQEEFGVLVGSFCPNILFPYARETIASLVQKAGFPEFVLQPLNFDALYTQSLEQQKSQAAQTEAH